MKKYIFATILILSFQNAFAEGTTLKDDTCKSLSNKFSYDAFKNEKDEANHLELENVKYFNTSKATLSNTMNSLCDSKKNLVSISEFKTEYNNTCAQVCKENKSLYSSKEKQQNYALSACLSICNNSARKLNALERGIKIASSQETMDVSSCNDQVAGTSRGAIKSVDRSTGKTTTGTKTSGK